MVCSLTGTQIRMGLVEGMKYRTYPTYWTYFTNCLAHRIREFLLLLGIKVPGLRLGSQVSSRAFGNAGNWWH